MTTLLPKPIYLTILLTTLLLFGGLGTGRAYAGSVIEHVVQPGETLSSIANQYGTTASRISRDNNISNPNLVNSGLVLRITVADAPASPPTAQPTDPPATENAPAATPVPPADQEDSNSAPASQPASSPAPTQASQPAATATPAPAQSCANYAGNNETRYTVRGGDTLSGLASRYVTSVAAIKSRNCLRSDTLIVGQLLIVPLGNGTGGNSGGASQSPTSDATRPPATPAPTRVPPTPSPQPKPRPTATPAPKQGDSWWDRLWNH